MADFQVSTTQAWIVLAAVLVLFTLLALGAARLLDCLPSILTKYCILKPPSSNKAQHQQPHGSDSGSNSSSDDSNNNDNSKLLFMASGTDYLLSARNAAGVPSLALSYFASGMGAWVLYGTTEMGATPSLSWLGVIGYSTASSMPALLLSWWGPQVRALSTGHQAFSTSDFARQRYGRSMQTVVAIVSGFYMFIYIVAELTSISNVFGLLTNNGDSTTYRVGITLVLAGATIFYTALAGLPASIITDKFQGMMIVVLVIVLCIALTTQPENHIQREQFALASHWTDQGAIAFVTLVIAISSAELFNQSNWQRVWAAQSVTAMRQGFLTGSVMIFFLMMFFGVMGMMGMYQNSSISCVYECTDLTKYASFFLYVLQPTPMIQKLTTILTNWPTCPFSICSVHSVLDGKC
jgi:solute:Na+ symporter, SSS family